MGREDQKEEREVLDSIFPDEITGTAPFFYSLLYRPQGIIPLTNSSDISDTEYRISITLDVDNEPGDDSPQRISFLSTRGGISSSLR